ncbi:MAG: phosphoribosyltransferase family protein [Chitinophagales bacterium]
MELPFTAFESFKENPVEKIFHGRVDLEFATSLLFFSKGERVQNIMHNIKYNEQKELAVFIGRIFAERLQNNPYLKDVTTIIPVPLHPQKQQVRGYNQSELFAEGMNEVLRKGIMTKIISRDINTETQTKKTRTERWENVEKAFFVRKPELLEHQHVLLVDDVLTTGATLEACAQTLLKSADCKVSVATVAFAL